MLSAHDIFELRLFGRTVVTSRFGQDEPTVLCSQYALVIDHAKNMHVPCITAEVDVEPVYNEASMRFHASMGFCEVGRKPFNGAVTVSLQKLDIG